MKQTFEMLDLGLTHNFLGMEIAQTNEGIFLLQERFALDLLIKFQLKNCKPVDILVIQNVKFEFDDGTTKGNGTMYKVLI